ncbi:MAG: ParB/RepB/Spo0J family partition protein [Phycisphaeraceae bacterium]|nr:ParB/RepB/Spo0J family partition protein [Phycisphaeraceae bacterium]
MLLVRTDEIVPSPFQPRRAFDQSALDRLAASIRSAGVMQPVLVRRSQSGEAPFELVAGERRWRAAKLVQLERIPAIVSVLTNEQAAEWALIENLQREELGPMERADGLKSLMVRFGLSHAQIAERVGLDRSSVTNLVRLTELEEPIRSLLEDRRLSAGHGKALLAAPAGTGRVDLANRAAAHSWSVRQTERASSRAAADLNPTSPASVRTVAHSDLERQLGEYLGTKVVVRANKKGTRGRIGINFYSLDHFDGLMSKIGFELR